MSSCKEESDSFLSLCAANGHEDVEHVDHATLGQSHAVSLSTSCGEVAIHSSKSVKASKMSPSGSANTNATVSSANATTSSSSCGNFSSSDALLQHRANVADMTKSKGDFEAFHLLPNKKSDSKHYKEDGSGGTKDKSRNSSSSSSSSKKTDKDGGKLYSSKDGVKCNDPDGKNNHYKSTMMGDKKDIKSKDRKGNKGGVGSLSSAGYSPLKAGGKEGRGVEMKSVADLEAMWQKEEEEKRKMEEERKKQEEELRLQEELLRKKKESEEALFQEELRTIQDYIQEVKERLDQKNYLRGKNLNAAENRPDETFFSKLDSNLRRNTAFVRKLRNLNETLKESLTKDIQSLNLSKYIGEAAAALTEAKLKMSDINCAVLICSRLHQSYADFSSCLMENWQKYLLCKKEERIANLSKYRVDLRFFAELVSVGLFSEKEGLHVLANQLSILVNSDKEEHNNLSIISSFCKHCGDDYVGIVPRKYRILAEKHDLVIERSNMLPPERQKACRNLLKDYYATLCKHLKKLHKDLKTIEQQNRKILQTKGELSNERKENYEAAIVNYQKLQQNTYTLADLLDEDIPDLPEEELKQDSEGAMFDIFNPIKNAEFHYEGDTSLFEDEDTRTFYESLPDLRSLIPGILYKESEHASSKDETKEDVTALDEDIETLKIEDIDPDVEFDQKDLPLDGLSKDKDDNKEHLKDEEIEEELDMIHPDIEEENDTGHLMKAQFDSFLQSLPNCVNRELIDKNAVDFCMNFNTKTNRKKLVRALFTVHRTRYDLLPFYSRLVATLYPCMPDVANDLVHLLKGDFRWHIRKKDQINIESKLKTVRFIGELVKFKMFPKTETLYCLKNLLMDFTHHNIEMACALLETCGRYLYRQMDSHHRTKVYLDVVMRKKAALHLDSRYITMIENAYYYSNPPEVPQMVKKIRPPMHEYIRKLLYKDLSKVTTEKVLRQMRKLDWDDPEVAFYATKCLTAVWNIRYNSIHCAANLLAGLAPYHELVAIQVVDGILEDIRIGMEINHPKYNQRRVSAIKYLGELYNYRMVESSVIFKVLYSFISFGTSLEDNIPSALDLPDHLFRIRLVCVLLDTCGQYFDKGSSKKKLDYFLVYFQRYYWFKRNLPLWTDDHPFPVDVDNLVRDTIEAVRPKLKLLESNEDAYKAVEDLEKEIKPKIAEVLPIIDTYDEGESNGIEDCGFSVIIESDEELSQNLSQVNNDENLIESETSQDDPSQSRTGSQVNDGEDYANSVHSEEDEEEDILESAGEDETEDQVTVLTGGPKHIKCTEDEDFLSAFDKMMVDNLQARSQESWKVPQLDIAVPMHLRGQVRKQFTFPQNSIEHNDTIKFVLMTKKGNKQQYTNLNVPISTEFAAKFKDRERAERAEKEQMKLVVLGIHERQEEEDYQEMLAALNRPAPVNTNRERRVRYQHPKGAPDADLIFGSKER